MLCNRFCSLLQVPSLQSHLLSLSEGPNSHTHPSLLGSPHLVGKMSNKFYRVVYSNPSPGHEEARQKNMYSVVDFC